MFDYLIVVLMYVWLINWNKYCIVVLMYIWLIRINCSKGFIIPEVHQTTSSSDIE